MKKIKYLVFALLLCLVKVSASDNMDTRTPIDIKVNGSYIKTDARPFIFSDSTYVPIRFVSEALSADVLWNAESSTATIRDNNTEIVLQEGKYYAHINGRYIKINGGIKLRDNRIFVPVRFMSESLGASVDWDADCFEVIINRNGADVPQSLKYDRGYTNEDIVWLSRIIEAEASGEPFDGKLGVGDVVINRVNSPDYPDTIHDVIFDDNFGVQFEPVANGTIYNEPSYESIIAAKYSLEGRDSVGDSLYFLNTATAASTWITENRPYYTAVGNHSFYL